MISMCRGSINITCINGKYIPMCNLIRQTRTVGRNINESGRQVSKYVNNTLDNRNMSTLYFIDDGPYQLRYKYSRVVMSMS